MTKEEKKQLVDALMKLVNHLNPKNETIIVEPLTEWQYVIKIGGIAYTLDLGFITLEEIEDAKEIKDTFEEELKLGLWDAMLKLEGVIKVPGMIQNAMQVNGIIINSRYRHDFEIHDGYFIDGGLDYVRCGETEEGKQHELISLVVNADDPIETKALKLVWGTTGKNNDEPFHWVKLSDCTDEHLKGILKTQKNINKYWEEAIQYILKLHNKKI